MQRRSIPAVLSFLLTIPGCATAPPEPKPEIGPALVAEAAKVGCPAPAAADRREATVALPRPSPDVTDADGRRFLSLGGLQRAVDERDAVLARKNRVIDRLAKHIDGCRDGSPAPAADAGSGASPPPEPEKPGRRMFAAVRETRS